MLDRRLQCAVIEGTNRSRPVVGVKFANKTLLSSARPQFYSASLPDNATPTIFHSVQLAMG